MAILRCRLPNEHEQRKDVNIMSAKVADVLVRPGRAGLPIEPRLRMISVPSQAKPVAICAGRRLQSPETLRYKRMLRLSDIMFEGCCFASIGNPAAHGIS